MDLSEIEDDAEELRTKQQRLEEVESELEEVIAELRELPKKAARETKFAKLVGQETASPKRVEEMEQRQETLSEERDELMDDLDELEIDLIESFLDEDLVIPLTTEPEKTPKEFIFGFRGGESYPHAIRFLGETTGLGHPIAIEGTLISEENVRVPIEFGMDESEAMESVVAAFEQIQNALKVKVPEENTF